MNSSTLRKEEFLVRVGVMAEETKLRIEKFEGKNYQHWKMQIEDYLYHKNLFLPLEGMDKKPMRQCPKRTRRS